MLAGTGLAPEAVDRGPWLPRSEFRKSRQVGLEVGTLNPSNPPYFPGDACTMTVIHYEISEAPTLAEASEFSKYIEDQRHVAAEIRRQTVSKAIRTGTKAAEVAFELGVSKTRVSQLFHEDASHSESLHEDEDQRELELSGAATAE
jgi:hypothetical protein